MNDVSPLTLAVGSRTDIGRHRGRNEDSMLVREPLFAVADGMGGHRGGNVASRMTVETLEQRAPVAGEDPVAAVRDAIREANRAVLERGDSDPDLQGMGTTVTALAVEDGSAEILHVGDSRAYLFRDGDVQQLTEDHTVAQEWVRRGRFTLEEAERLPQRSMLTRALGVEDDVDVDHISVGLHDRDRFLLCSDGLTNMLADAEIREILAISPEPQEAADRLVSMANEAGGDDNITVIVVDVAWKGGTAAGMAEAAAQAGDPAAGEDETTTTGQLSPVAGGPRRSGRWLALALMLALVIGVVAGFLGIRSYLQGQWYVGTSGANVAIYRGIPATVLGVRLSHVDRVTRLSAHEAARFASGLRDGIHASSRLDAERIVGGLQRTLCESETATCVLGSAG